MRCAIFIDGQNLFYVQRICLGWNINLKNLIRYFEDRGATASDAYYYTTYIPQVESQQNYLQMISSFGYAVVAKPVKSIPQEDTLKSTGSMIVDIVLDLVNTQNTYDCAILFCGDANIERALRTLRSKGKDFYVISHPDATAKEILELSGSHFLDVSTMERYIKLQQRPARPYISGSQDRLVPV